MTADQHCPHCGNTVKPALTRNRRRRQSKTTSTPTSCAAPSAATPGASAGRHRRHRQLQRAGRRSSEQLAEAVFLLRVRGYSWTDISLRLGATRQAAQQRWGTPA